MLREIKSRRLSSYDLFSIYKAVRFLQKRMIIQNKVINNVISSHQYYVRHRLKGVIKRAQKNQNEQDRRYAFYKRLQKIVNRTKPLAIVDHHKSNKEKRYLIALTNQERCKLQFLLRRSLTPASK